MSDTYDDAISLEVLIPVYHNFGISLDVAKESYEDYYDEPWTVDHFADFAMNNIRADDWREAKMFEVVDDEGTADYDVFEEHWLNAPKRITDVDGNGLWSTRDFSEVYWRD